MHNFRFIFKDEGDDDYTNLMPNQAIEINQLISYDEDLDSYRRKVKSEDLINNNSI